MPDPPRSAQAQRGATRKPARLASVPSRPNHRGTLGLPSDRARACTIGTTGRMGDASNVVTRSTRKPHPPRKRARAGVGNRAGDLPGPRRSSGRTSQVPAFRPPVPYFRWPSIAVPLGIGSPRSIDRRGVRPDESHPPEVPSLAVLPHTPNRPAFGLSGFGRRVRSPGSPPVCPRVGL